MAVLTKKKIPTTTMKKVGAVSAIARFRAAQRGEQINKTATNPKLTGRANAVTRGQGKKIGLMRQLTTPRPIVVKPPGSGPWGHDRPGPGLPPAKPPVADTTKWSARPDVKGQPPVRPTSWRNPPPAKPPVPPPNSIDIWKGAPGGVPLGTKPTTAQRVKALQAGKKFKTKPTGRAKALTRGKGKKLGLKKQAGRRTYLLKKNM